MLFKGETRNEHSYFRDAILEMLQSQETDEEHSLFLQALSLSLIVTIYPVQRAKSSVSNYLESAVCIYTIEAPSRLQN
jgi:hypothetical protein